MWINCKDYALLTRLAAEGSVDAAHYRLRLSEAHTEIGRLRKEVELEKARANGAIDALLQSKGQPPVTPSEIPDPTQLFEEDPDELKRMAKAIAEGGVVSVLDEAR